jgi:hypothetical protein
MSQPVIFTVLGWQQRPSLVFQVGKKVLLPVTEEGLRDYGYK